MPYRDWTPHEIDVELRPQSKTGIFELELSATPQLWWELAQALEEVSNERGSELRHKLTESFTLFWKHRDGENRFIVAHPAAEEWVGTLALTSTFAGDLISELKKSHDLGTRINLKERGGSDRISNFNLLLGWKSFDSLGP